MSATSLDEGARRLLPYITSDVVQKYACDLIRYPSVNPPGDYSEVMDYVLQEFKELGLEIATTACHAGRTNVVGRLRGSGDGRALCLAAHTDVVGVGDKHRWSFDPFEASIENGVLQGRGGADSKGMLAGMMAAVRAFREANLSPKGDLYIVAYVDDETAGPCGLRDVYQQGLVSADQLVLGEATNFEIQHVFKARLWFSVEVFGRASHGAFPDRGINAIDKGYRTIETLRTLPLFDHPKLGRDTVSVGMIRGGEQVNIVAEKCRVWFDIRWSPPRTSGEIRDEVQSSLERTRVADGEMQLGGLQIDEERDPLEFPEHSELNDSLIGAASRVLGREVGLGGWYSSGELWPVWRQGKIKTGAVIGPGEPWQAHAYDEQILVSSLVDGARVYALTALSVCDWE